MADREQVQRLIEELGPASDAVVAIRQYGDTSWLVAFDEATEVELDYDAGRGMLALAIDLGMPAPAARARICETLLTTNFLRQETGGLTMALEAPDGAAVQMLDLNAEGLDLATFAMVLDNFVAQAREWRALVGTAGEPGEAPPADDDPRFAPGMLRV
jgi:hypothetical protein